VAIIDIGDLPAALQNAELIDVMVAGVNAKASRVAPCLTDTTTPPTLDQIDEARLVLIGAVKRWVEAGAGALQAQTVGPFGMTVDTRQKSSGFNLWPSEIEQLQAICSTGTVTSGAFTIDTVGLSSSHADVCSLNLGATFCSCGADLTNYTYPLYEV
jgi:hypothetical protein